MKSTFKCVIWAMYPFLKKKLIEIKTHVLWVQNSLWNKKIKIDYIDKSNVKYIQILEINFAMWLALFLSLSRCVKP